MTADTMDRLSGVGAAMVVIGLVLALASSAGCATGLEAAERALPTVSMGLQKASMSGLDTLRDLCAKAAVDCRTNGVTDQLRCPGWLKCDSVRSALEEITRAVEDDLSGVKSKIRAYRKTRAAIEALKGESNGNQ